MIRGCSTPPLLPKLHTQRNVASNFVKAPPHLVWYNIIVCVHGYGLEVLGNHTA